MKQLHHALSSDGETGTRTPTRALTPLVASSFSRHNEMASCNPTALVLRTCCNRR